MYSQRTHHNNMEGELRILAAVCASATVALCYCYYLSSRISPGKRRLLSLLPVLYLFTQLPLSFSTVHLRGTFGFFLSWLAILKLLLFSFQRGPLSDPTLSLPNFLAVASLPVKIRQPGDTHLPKLPKRVLLPPLVPFALKGALLAFIVSFYPQRHLYPRGAVLIAYGVHMYLTLDLVLGIAAAVSLGLLGGGVELEPQMSAPYLSSSLQDFWGRRWNIMVTRLLHQAVYAPVRSRWGPLVGVLASFLVSSLVHEAMFYYLTLRGPTGEVTCFFLLQGVSMAAELWAKGVLRGRGWVVPRAVAALLTVAYVWGTGLVLFFPPLLRGGETEEAVVGECLAMYEAGRAAVVKAVALFS